MLKVLASAVVGVLSLTYMAPSWAQADHSAFELAMLPDYCQARLGHDEQVKKPWRQRMGQNFDHLHHYCSGLTYMRRARTTVDLTKRNQNLETALKEFNYVIKNWTPDFYLVKDAKGQRTEASILLGRPVPLQ